MRREERDVAIVGAALSDLGRLDDVAAHDLHFQATSRALDDAGLGKVDVDGFFSCGLGTLAPIEICEYLDIRPTIVNSTMVGGSSWEFMVLDAMSAIRAGQASVIVLSYGSTLRSDLRKGVRPSNLAFGGAGPLQFDEPFGHTLISKYAMAARRHMWQYGTTEEQLASISCVAREYASLNPGAYYREPLSVDDVLQSPMVADPLTKLQCCIRSDGGGAIVLADAETARRCRKEPVWVLGAGQAVSHVSMSEWDDFCLTPAVESGRRAFEHAGLKPADVDVVQLYDSFTITVLLALENLGFCSPGEGGAFVESGSLGLGGALPTNTDGGGLSHAHPGHRGIFLLVEATRQLRDECGPRQVRDAAVACVSGMGGWFSSSGTVLLGRD